MGVKILFWRGVEMCIIEPRSLLEPVHPARFSSQPRSVVATVNQVVWIGCKKLVNRKLRLTNQLWLPIMENSWDWWVAIAGINYRTLFSYHGDQPWHTSQNFLAVILCFYNFISCTTWVLLFSAENSIFSWVNYWLCNIYSNLQNWKKFLDSAY